MTGVLIYPAAGRWVVEADGEVLLKSARDPEHEACRALLARGVTGKVTFHHRDGMPGLSMDIERGAGLSTDDSTQDGRPRIRKFRPYRATG